MSERILPAPYKGMAPYSERDAAFFFGRENEPKNIIFNLMASRLTLLYGESGVGKSSLMRAGVVHNLRRRARKNVEEGGSPEFAVAIFNEWRDDPVAGLTTCVRDAIIRALSDRAIEHPPASNSLVDTLQAWTDVAAGPLYVILDQFEDYFLYPRHEERDGRFASEFSRVVNCRDLRVSFLISIRDDSYAKLDCFEESIPNIFQNTLRLEHLDRTATEAAIRKPIDQYNRFYAAGRTRISIDDDLVSEVLKGPSVPKTWHRNAAQVGAAGAETVIETPFLQLVMTCLWKEEMRLGSTRLRLETLKSLGGVDKIVETHLGQAMNKLSRKERKMAVPVFHHLVTRSGHKMAYAVSDLADQARFDEQELTVLLEKLSSGENRILHPFDLRERPGERLYEISLDVLARPILDWRTRAEEKLKAVRLLYQVLMGTAIVFALVVGIFFYVTELRSKRQAVAAGNENSQIFAQLHGVILNSDDAREAAEKLKKIMSSLDGMLEENRRLGNSIGEGITLNIIAGYHRYIGESYAAAEEDGEARRYYQKAQDYYGQALEVLTKAMGQNSTDAATSLTGQAVTHMDMGEYAQAEPLYVRSLEILKKALKPDDDSVADATLNLAECYNSQGKYTAAEPYYQRALEIRKNKLSEDHSELAVSLYGMAWLDIERGMYAEAEPLLQQALAIWQADPQDLRSTGMCLDALSALYREWGKYNEAEQFSNQSLNTYKKVINENTKMTATDQDHLLAAYYFENAALLHDKQSKDDAEKLFGFAIDILTKGLGDGHPDAARNRSNLASFYYSKGKPGEAEKLFNQALEVLKALPDSPDLAQTLFGLAQIYTGRGQYADAEPLFIQALEIQTTAIPNHRKTLDTLLAYADLLRKTNRDGDASQIEERANKLRDKLEN